MVENRHILYSLTAGAIAGAFSSVVMTLMPSGAIEDLVRELMHQQLLWSGVPQENISEIVVRVIESLKWIYWLIPLGPIINMLFFGALLGLLLDFLVKKLKRPYVASLLTGTFFMVLLQLLPLLLLEAVYGSWFTELLNKYMGMPLIIAPSVLYTVLLTIFSSVKGPWTRWGEAKPKMY